MLHKKWNFVLAAATPAAADNSDDPAASGAAAAADDDDDDDDDDDEDDDDDDDGDGIHFGDSGGCGSISQLRSSLFFCSKSMMCFEKIQHKTVSLNRQVEIQV